MEISEGLMFRKWKLGNDFHDLMFEVHLHLSYGMYPYKRKFEDEILQTVK